MIKKFILKIKRRENKFYLFLYNTLSSMRRFNIPSIKIIYLPLFYIIEFFKSFLILLKRKLYDEPVFKARCEKVGKGLRLPNGLPLVTGNLKIILGDNVTIYRTTFGASHVSDVPELIIGNDSTIGYGTTISVAQKVEIGSNVLIAANCYLTDNDEHPIDPIKRNAYESVSIEDVKPIRIKNSCWIGYNSVILKGVELGKNTIIGAHSTVLRSIDENSLAQGYPARVVMKIDS